MTADRRDLFSDGTVAHVSLRGKVTADRFVEGAGTSVKVPVADVHRHVGATALERQILYGHPVTLLDARSGFSRDDTTGYVGYVAPQQLGAQTVPTHRVAVRSTFLFKTADIKSPNPLLVSFGSLLRIVEDLDLFSRTADNRFVVRGHLTPVEQRQPDLAATAKALLGTPYLWGGNSAAGIDCSGLVQLAAQAAGLECPGDSDQQRDRLGTAVETGTGFQRNDLLFWKGHVALLFDEATLIHANAHHMAVALEPLGAALDRIERSSGPLLAQKRL